MALLDILPDLRADGGDTVELKLCDKCKYARKVWANGGWSFIGCYGGDYHGKWVAEIEQCPIFGDALSKGMEKELQKEAVKWE